MRLGFGCLMVLRLFGTGKPAALFDIHQSDIFPSGMHLAQQSKGFMYVCVSLLST
jgi:hypothetical protein